jgi:hypothetical protein
MKKVSTQGSSAEQEYFAAATDHWIGSGRSQPLVLPGGRSRPDTTGTASPYERESVARSLRRPAGSRIALEIGTHSPWISRLLRELGHEVIVANARKVRLIGESRKKDDRLDATALCSTEEDLVGQIAPEAH